MSEYEGDLPFWEAVREWWVVDMGPTVYGAIIWICVIVLFALAFTECYGG